MKNKNTNPIRKYLEKNIDELLFQNGNIEETLNSISEAYFLYFTAISGETAELEEDEYYRSMKTFYYTLCQTAFIDAYKEYSYKLKHLNLFDNDLDIFLDLDDMESFDDVFSVISYNPFLFNRMLNSTYDFSIRTELEKILKVRSLSDAENEKLLEIAPIHQLDLDKYGKTNPINFEKLMKMYAKQYKAYTEDESNNEYHLLLAFASFIRELYLVDRKNAIDLLISIAKKDYIIAKKFLNTSQFSDVLENHINCYENNDQEDILTTLLTNQEFLIDALDLVISIIVHENFEGRIINKRSIDFEEKNDIIKKLERKIK